MVGFDSVTLSRLISSHFVPRSTDASGPIPIPPVAPSGPHTRTREPMQPPPQLVQWLRQNYPKPSVDEVRVLGVDVLWARALTTLSFNPGSTGFRNATPG